MKRTETNNKNLEEEVDRKFSKAQVNSSVVWFTGYGWSEVCSTHNSKIHSNMYNDIKLQLYLYLFIFKLMKLVISYQKCQNHSSIFISGSGHTGIIFL